MNPIEPSEQEAVLDSTGAASLVVGTIASIVRNCYPWDQHQALVVSLSSDGCPQGGPIAVYFDREVEGHHFFQRGDVPQWDAAHPTVTLDELLSNQLWKTCPRIWHFQPADLKVDPGWKVGTLIQRTFPLRNYHHICVTEQFPQLGSNPCPTKDCQGGAAARDTHVILINVHGTIAPILGCECCHREYNGNRRDDLPALKEPADYASAVAAMETA